MPFNAYFSKSMDKTVKSQLSFYNKISELIVTATDAESLSRALYEIIDGYIEVPHSALFLWDSKEAKLKLYGNSGFTEDELVEVENTALDRHPGWVFKNQKPLHIPDMDKEGVPSFITSSKRGNTFFIHVRNMKVFPLLSLQVKDLSR